MLITAACAARPELAPFEHYVLPPHEDCAANVLVLGQQVILPAGYDIAVSMVEEAGLAPHLLDMSEFEKRDGGVTCLSLLW
jgi:dimethylargininase